MISDKVGAPLFNTPPQRSFFSESHVEPFYSPYFPQETTQELRTESTVKSPIFSPLVLSRSSCPTVRFLYDPLRPPSMTYGFLV